MESITGKRPLLTALGRGFARPDRDGIILGLGVLGAMVALDASLGTPGLLVGTFVLAPFIPAVLGRVLATVAVGAAAVLAGFASPLWDVDFNQAEYWIANAGLIVAAGFAIVAARARHRAQINSQRFEVLDAVGAIADGSLPLAETLDRVVDMVVPAAADMCMIDAIHDGRVVRAAVRAAGRGDSAQVEARVRQRKPSVPDRFIAGERAWIEIPHFRARMDAEDVRRIAHDSEDLEFLESLDLRSWTVAAMSARGRSLGTLTLITAWSKRRYTPDDVRFAQVLANRVGLALDNAGLFSDLEGVERRLDAVMSMLDEAVVVHDAAGRLVFLNDAAAHWLGFSGPEEALAETGAELVGRLRMWSEDGRRLDGEPIIDRIREANLPWRGLVRIAGPGLDGNRWVVVNSASIDDPAGRALYAVTTAEDVTELKRSEFTQQLLANTGELLTSSTDYPEMLQAVARLAVPRFADWCSVNIPDREGLVERVAIAHSDPDQIASIQELRAQHPVRIDDGTPLSEVIRTGSPRLITETAEEPRDADSGAGDAQRLIRGVGSGSTIAVPLAAGAKVVGVLAFVNEPGSRSFDEGDLEIALEIARRAGLAVENARLASERSEVARVLQRGLSPPALPDLRGFEMAAMYRPAGEVNEVGGDFYDAFEIEGGSMVVIGDVMGRGAAAASLTALARHTIRTAGRLTANPCLAASLVDDSLKSGSELLLCSAVILVLPNTDEDPVPISMLVAGHPPPLLVRDGLVEAVGPTGPLLGAPDDHEWELTTVDLGIGDQVVLYTDGVTEARGPGNRFGERRLRSTFAGATRPEAIVASVEVALDSFIDGEPEDDAAVLAIMRSRAPRDGASGFSVDPDRVSLAGEPLDGVSTPRGRGSAVRNPVRASPKGKA
jgi:PAS domain S-box-containing protein